MGISVRPARQFPVNFLKSFGPKKNKVLSPLHPKNLPQKTSSHSLGKMKISQFSLLCARFALLSFSVFFACSLDFLICTESYSLYPITYADIVVHKYIVLSHSLSLFMRLSRSPTTAGPLAGERATCRQSKRAQFRRCYRESTVVAIGAA